MGFYDALKDAMNLAQKADNIELYRQLLDLSAQALDLQAEVARLREENADLKKCRDLSQVIIRHKGPYITRCDDDKELYYCSHCWDADERLIQLICDFEYGIFECPHCHMRGEYTSDKKRTGEEIQKESDNNPYKSYIEW